MNKTNIIIIILSISAIILSSTTLVLAFYPYTLGHWTNWGGLGSVAYWNGTEDWFEVGGNGSTKQFHPDANWALRCDLMYSWDTHTWNGFNADCHDMIMAKGGRAVAELLGDGGNYTWSWVKYPGQGPFQMGYYNQNNAGIHPMIEFDPWNNSTLIWPFPNGNLYIPNATHNGFCKISINPTTNVMSCVKP